MKTLFKYYCRIALFLVPLFFLPISTDPYGVGKNWFIIVTGLIGLVLWAITQITDKKEAGVKYNSLLIIGLLLLIWAGITWWMEPIGVRMRSLESPMGMGTVMGLAAWMFLWLQLQEKNERSKQMNLLSASGIVIALSSLVVFMIPNAKFPILLPKNNPIIGISQNWSLTGSLLTEVIFLAFLAAEWIKGLLHKFQGKEENGYIKEAVLAAIFVLVLFLDVFRISKLGWLMLDGNSSWMIAAEAFKRSPIFGVGIGNFMEAFTQLRPVSFNLTKVWSNVFVGSSMGILQVWTELGVVGLILVLAAGSLILKKRKNSFGYYRLVVLLLINLFLPFNLLSLVLLVWVASGSLFEHKHLGLVLKVGDKGFNAAPILTLIAVGGAVVFGNYWMGKIALGEFYMRNAMIAAANGDGLNTYNLEIKAIGFNPYDPDYRKVYSQTNIALATKLLENKSLSDQDKQNASVFIQQGVREAKTAISLDSSNAGYWSNLAVIYKQLIGVVDGAADWSYQAYSQAIILDPVNPLLKLDTGGLLFAAQRYDDADRIFEQVVSNKQDFANGWYNWAYTAKQLNKIDVAVARLSQAVALVPVDSGDYQNASKELDSWKKELDAAVKKQQEQAKQAAANQEVTLTPTPTPKQPESFKTAQPLPTMGKEEKVNLPAADLQPPATTPIATPTTQAEVTPQMTPTSQP